MSKTTGTVYLVGAGPGNAQLITLRGAELLRHADVVVYDSLVNPELARLAPAGAEIIGRSAVRPFGQKEINDLLLARARAGKCVVRLKGGDPYVFGRGGEEAEHLAAAGVPFEVVPGVSSLAAVPGFAGIPVTHRTLASTLTVITGHEDPAKPARGVDWELVARLPGTKVILMGAERLAGIATALESHGLAAGTPVAVVEAGTTGAQRTLVGTLADIAAKASGARLASPATIIIGDVVALRAKLDWFESRPLFGKRIVVTRSRDQAGALTRPLQERGAEVLEVPCLKFAPPAEREHFVEALAGLGNYDWMIFTSANGVTTFFEAFFKAYDDIRCLGMVRLAAVGPATAARLREHHLKVDLVPAEYVAEQIAKELAATESLENLRVLLLRAEVANPELPRLLEDMGAIVDDIAAYRTVVDTEDWNGAAARFAAEGADWITFASGSAVRFFHERFDLGRLRKSFPALKFASIGPETTRVLQSLGADADLEAKPYTVEGLVQAITRAVAKS